VKVSVTFIAESAQEAGMLGLIRTARPEIRTDEGGANSFLRDASLSDVYEITGALCKLEDHLAKIKMTRPGK
jgi:hypothetical protein